MMEQEWFLLSNFFTGYILIFHTYVSLPEGNIYIYIHLEIPCFFLVGDPSCSVVKTQFPGLGLFAARDFEEVEPGQAG